jgi:hypothetical protein
MNTEQGSMGFYLRERGSGTFGFSSLLVKVFIDFYTETLDSYFQIFTIVYFKFRVHLTFRTIFPTHSTT